MGIYWLCGVSGVDVFRMGHVRVCEWIHALEHVRGPNDSRSRATRSTEHTNI